MTVTLVSHDASDEKVVNSARVSFDRHTEFFDPAKDERLVRYLMENGHGSPFEHSTFTFLVKCPIFVARQWFKHRIGSFNEISGRYVELTEDYWKPAATDIRGGEAASWEDSAKMISGVQAFAFEHYHMLLKRGVPKEQARAVLPLGTYTEFYWTVNARSLMNYLMLRNDEHAQPEHREYARQVEGHFEIVMPYTYKAFIDNGRKAP